MLRNVKKTFNVVLILLCIVSCTGYNIKADAMQEEKLETLAQNNHEILNQEYRKLIIHLTNILKMLSKTSQIINKKYTFSGENAQCTFNPIIFNQNFICIAAQENNPKLVKYIIKKEPLEVNKQDLIGCTPLHYFAKLGNKNMVTFLLRNKAISTIKDKKSETAFFKACKYGKKEIAKILFNKKELTLKNNSNETVLHIVCKNKHYNITKYLFNKGASLSERDHEGQTPFFIICKHGDVDIAQLIYQKEQLEISNKNYKTPLHIACQNGHLKIVKFLLKCRVNVNIRPIKFNKIIALILCEITPLYLASSNGHEKIVKLLIENGSTIQQSDIRAAKTKEIKRYLQDIKNQNQKEKRRKNLKRLKTIFRFKRNEKLIENKTNIKDCRSIVGKEAATHINLQKYKKKSFEKEVFIPKNKKEKPSNLKRVKYLIRESIKLYKIIKHCAYFEDKDYTFHGPRLEVIKYDGSGDPHSTYYLTNIKINPCNFSRNIKFKIKVKGEAGTKEVYKNIYSKKISKLINSLKLPKNKEDIAEEINSRKSEINQIYEILSKISYLPCNRFTYQIPATGYSDGPKNIKITINPNHFSKNIIHVACQQQAFEVIKYAIKTYGKNIVNEQDQTGNYPMHYAAMTGNIDIIKLLILNGALNHKNFNKQAALHLACCNRHNEVVQYLCLYKVNLNSRDKKYKAPLSYACEKGYIKIVKTLISRGAKIDVGILFNRKSPLYLASKNGHFEIVKCLVRNGAKIRRACRKIAKYKYIAAYLKNMNTKRTDEKKKKNKEKLKKMFKLPKIKRKKKRDDNIYKKLEEGDDYDTDEDDRQLTRL